jgi:tRNA U38,U39,U40 pseudouridine synthase TruA
LALHNDTFKEVLAWLAARETDMNNATGSTCQGCGLEFPSRNAIFKHLKATNGACLPPAHLQAFRNYVQKQRRDKVILLFGYLTNHISDKDESAVATSISKKILNGTDAAQLLLQVLESSEDKTSTTDAGKINRSYGSTARNTNIVKQDDGTGAITEVLMTRLPHLVVPLDDWLDDTNAKLDCVLRQEYLVEGSDCLLPRVRLLGRQNISFSKFNAELDVTHRRVEYMLPADFLFEGDSLSRADFFHSFPSFYDGSHIADSEHKDRRRPSVKALEYLHSFKKKMQSLTTQIVALDISDPAAVLEKEMHNQKRYRGIQQHNERQRAPNNISRNDSSLDPAETRSKSLDHNEEDKPKKKQKAPRKKTKMKTDSSKTQYVLKRRRFHNFTATVMAHEFLAYRRLDRIYHRATSRFSIDETTTTTVACDNNQTQRPFLTLSLTGDLFLHGQACRVVGLLVALTRGLIDEDIVDCLFDEDYGRLVPTPPAPVLGLYAGDAFYVSWEGKARAILTPRKCNTFADGWGDDKTLGRLKAWKDEVRRSVAHSWLSRGVDEDNRLVAERKWTESVLEPWAKRSREQLQEYRLWKASLTFPNGGAKVEASLVPPLETIDPAVPKLFEKVLYYLREADAGGLWPSTTPKRQMVMISSLVEDAGESGSDRVSLPSSLSDAHIKAKANKEARSSAYVFVEGEGGASGSFSIGAMPGDRCKTQPKANAMFPELMKAAFELEMALCPDREPSSTIAVNRNAQFRPHTDVGAGAGQSQSLIVALGTYSGGELVVEGDKIDIRYNALQFDGWKQRHWTMPFKGERYSLVWFTPKGCENVHGIDLCK